MDVSLPILAGIAPLVVTGGAAGRPSPPLRPAAGLADIPGVTRGKRGEAVVRDRTILIVDDGPGNLMVLGEVLSPVYRVQAADSSARALELAGRRPQSPI